MASYGVDYSEVGMPYEVQGVVSRAKGEPVSLESVTVPGPGPGEAVGDGTALSPALGVGVFHEKTLVHSGQCTKAGPAAGLLGCGVLAGLGPASRVAVRSNRRGTAIACPPAAW